MPSSPIVAIRDLSFSYPGSIESTIDHITLTLPRGFTGVLGENGAGKSTLLKLLAGQLSPDEGSLSGVEHLVFCEQRTDRAPSGFAALLAEDSGDAWAIRGRLGLEEDFVDRWLTLSQGERKRSQIGTALWQQPDVLLIDEPTNHIDASTRALLIQNLQQFRGIGVLVSHDRALLDQLCDQCVWVESGRGQVFPGGYTTASQLRDEQRSARNRRHLSAKRELDRLQGETARRRERADRVSHVSKKGIDTKDHDAKSRIDALRVSGKDGVAGQVLRQMDARSARARASLESSRFEKTASADVWVEGVKSPTNPILFMATSSLDLSGLRKLHWPDLQIDRSDRVVLMGDNGMGKSTLIHRILETVTMAQDRVVVLPQELTEAEGQRTLSEVKALDRQSLGRIMQIIKRLGSEPRRLIDSASPSPGELRKLLLALGMLRAPYFIVMDEPTNHLDLPSIEALAAALQSCPCALLLITHDQQLASAVAIRHWHLVAEGMDSHLLETRM